MSRRPQLALAFTLAVLVVIGERASPAFAQRRALRRALLNAAADARQPSLLDRMFSRNRPCTTGRCFSRPTVNFFYASNGTPYDAYAEASLINRYSQPSFPTTSVGGFTSSNVANVYAPASYQLTPTPGVMYGGGEPAPLSTQISTFAVPTRPSISDADFINTGGVDGELRDALWRIGKAKREAPAQIQSRHPGAVTPPLAVRDNYNRTPDEQIGRKALRAGMLAFRDEDYTRAFTEYRVAMRSGCIDARSRLGIVLAQFALGHFDDAAATLGSDLISSPTLDRSALDVRMAYARPENFNGHLARLEAAAAEWPDKVEYLLLAGFMRYHSGDKEGGRRALERYASSVQADQDVVAVIQRFAPDAIASADLPATR